MIPLRFVALALLALSLLWYARRAQLFPGSRGGRQANRELARSKPGLVYFGALLGVGLFTQMSTPLVYAGAAASLSQGTTWGALFGFGFGLGRSAPALAGPFLATRDLTPATVANAVVVRFQSEARALGLVTSAAGLVMLGWLAI